MEFMQIIQFLKEAFLVCCAKPFCCNSLYLYFIFQKMVFFPFIYDVFRSMRFALNTVHCIFALNQLLPFKDHQLNNRIQLKNIINRVNRIMYIFVLIVTVFSHWIATVCLFAQIRCYYALLLLLLWFFLSPIDKIIDMHLHVPFDTLWFILYWWLNQ